MADDKEFRNQTEKRRRELLQKLDNGNLEGREDIEFLLDQYLKDNEIELGDAGKENLKKILTEGKGNFKSVSDQYKDIQQQNLSSRLKTEVYPIGGAEAMASTQMQGHTVNLDLGLSDVLSKIDEVKAKDNLYQDIIKARQSAAEHKYKGTEDHTDLRANLYNQLDDVKWYQFKRRRDANKAIRDINPDDYWSTKKVNGNPVLAASGYYRMRQWIANRSDRRYKRAAQQLETNVKDRIKDSELRWFSKDFGKKLGLKTKSLWRTVTFRGTNRALKRLTSNGNITKLQDISKQYADLEKQYKAKVPSGSKTKLQQRYLDTINHVIGQVKSGCSDGITTLNQQYEQAKKDASNIRSSEIESVIKKYTVQLQKVADSINKNTLNDIRDCSAYKAYLKANKGKPDASGFSKVTAQDVLKQILDNKVQSGEISQEEAGKQMEIFYPKQAETPTPENSQGDEQTKEEQLENQGKESELGEKDNGSKTLELEAEKNTKLADEMKKDGWKKEGDGSKYTKEVDGKNQSIEFLYNPENNRYSLKTLDENGEKRNATKEDYKALAMAMKANGISSVNIANLPEGELEAALQGLKEAGMTITNEKEVEEKIKEQKNQRETEEQNRQQNDDGGKPKENNEESKDDTKPKTEEQQDEKNKQQNKEDEKPKEKDNQNKEGEKNKENSAEKNKKTKEKNSENSEDISLENITSYIKGLHLKGHEDIKNNGETPKKFKDLTLAEQKLARQLHAHRMNIIKKAKEKGASTEEIYKAAEQGTVNWLKGRLSNTTSTKKRDKQIKELANANVRISRPKQSESGRG